MKQEIALLDVREEGPYAESHPLFAVSVPVSEIESKLPTLVPRLAAPIVVYDNGEGYDTRAVSRISAMGYTNVSILEGGLSAYVLVGEVYRDVGVPSKAFGELVESINHTPSVSARELKEALESQTDLVVLDARRLEEFNTMSIPGGRSCPGGELLYRFFETVPSPKTTVVVNCAGRTRSIIGAQSLINAKVPNKVVALRNGTIGKAVRHANCWFLQLDIATIGMTELDNLARLVEDRTVYLLDVRDPEEYSVSHPAGFTNAPGGQLVQATDEWIGVRGALVIIYDTDYVRARMTASWLFQLGWEVNVLSLPDSPYPDELVVPKAPSFCFSKFHGIPVDALRNFQGATVVDLARSPAYRKGHIPGAWFASGPELVRDLKQISGDDPIVLTSPDGFVASMNLEDARHSVRQRVLYLEGGTEAWAAAGYPLETESRWLSEPMDVYKRPYEGTGNARENMQGYLDWEYGLVAQLANDGVAGFRVARDRRPSAECYRLDESDESS
jgi:rhodanese-related sulfurtransferase